MSFESNGESYTMEANLIEEYGLIIKLDENGLAYLVKILQDLKDRRAGTHYHFDQFTGLEGNVPSIILMRS